MDQNPDLTLRKFLAPEIIFGPGARKLAGQYTQNLGLRKILVVSDHGVAAAGWTSELINLLNAEGVETEVFLDVTPNPKDHEAIKGAEVYRRTGCEGIIAIGGGSPMDCAKIIGLLAANPGNPMDYMGIDQIPDPGPPMICIPTTAGSSADVSQFAILTDTERRVKVAFVSKLLVPDVALIDPETTVSMDKSLTSATVLDALTHAFEAYVSKAHSPITDIHAAEAVKIILKDLIPCLENPENIELRSRLMRASMEAGLAFSNTSLGAVHALAHSLGGYLNAPHGECNAVLLSTVIKFNWPNASERYIRLMEMSGIQIDDKKSSSGVTTALNKLIEGAVVDEEPFKTITETDIESMASRAINDPCLLTNPRECSETDLKELYEQAFG